MSNTAVIEVKEAVEGKFGPQVKTTDGQYLSFSKYFKGDTDLPPGQYEVELYISDKGNRYINAVISAATSGAPPAAPAKRGRKAATKVTDKVAVAAPAPSAGGRDFDREAFGKIKSLFLQAIMPVLITNPNDKDAIKETIREWALYAMEDDRA